LNPVLKIKASNSVLSH